jgi:hypothetical protein
MKKEGRKGSITDYKKEVRQNETFPDGSYATGIHWCRPLFWRG